jgi:hypothetical protein
VGHLTSISRPMALLWVTSGLVATTLYSHQEWLHPPRANIWGARKILLVGLAIPQSICTFPKESIALAFSLNRGLRFKGDPQGSPKVVTPQSWNDQPPPLKVRGWPTTPSPFEGVVGLLQPHPWVVDHP